MIPLVHAVSVNEWPLPTTFSVRPPASDSLTAATSSSVPLGRTMAAGEHRWLPAQLVHCATAFSSWP
jgi:hypothetical protein